MTTKQLEQKISELEKRIALLEGQRPVINVYPQIVNPVPMPSQPQFPPITGPWCGDNPKQPLITTC